MPSECCRVISFGLELGLGEGSEKRGFIVMKTAYTLVVVVVMISIVGCTGLEIDRAIAKYNGAANQVQLGDTKEKVLSILQPTQEGLPAAAKKPSEAFLLSGKEVEIFYFRSGRQPDNLTTDDEFTPYVFTDGVLTGFGWQVLGGPKTVGQKRSERTTIYKEPERTKSGCGTIYSTTRGYHKPVGCE